MNVPIFTVMYNQNEKKGPQKIEDILKLADTIGSRSPTTAQPSNLKHALYRIHRVPNH